MSVALKTVCRFKIRQSFLMIVCFDKKYVHIMKQSALG